MNSRTKKISFILPCLNEQAGLQIVIPEIIQVATRNNLNYEIIIADNNSTDDSIKIAREIAQKFNASEKLIIITEKIKGYGSAYQAGFNNATGDIFIMADSDGTYDFSNVNKFLDKIDAGYEMVIGNRFSGEMEKKAMPFINRYLGNPILSGLVRILFNIKIKDIHSGMRCITRDAYFRLDLYTKGMEYASEMIIQAGKKHIKATEIDMNYRVRSGDSKLEKFTDGWRHLRFILIYSPYYTFFIPGAILFATGVLVNSVLYFKNIKISSFLFQTHPMFFFFTAITIGYQLMFFALFNKVYSYYHLSDDNNFTKKFLKFFTLEKILITSLALFLISVLILIYVAFAWVSVSFGTIDQIKNLVWGITFFTLSVQTFFSGLMISIIGVRGR